MISMIVFLLGCVTGGSIAAIALMLLAYAKDKEEE